MSGLSLSNGKFIIVDALKKELEAEGEKFRTDSDTEVLLVGYMRYGSDFVKRLNGIFAFGIWDGRLQNFSCSGTGQG